MKLPSKSTPYKNSVLTLFPSILSMLKEHDMRITDLQKELPEVYLGDLISTLDCLYALKMVELDGERRTISYVGEDSM